MTIPQSIRDQIGTGDLAPVWRLRAHDGYPGTGTSVDITDDILTTPGPAISARADLTTAPVRQLEVTTTTLEPFGVTDADDLMYVLEAGYRDAGGTAYFEDVGAYFFDTQERRNGEYITRFGSAEIQVFGKRNYGDDGNEALPLAVRAAMLETTGAGRFRVYVTKALDAALPLKWPCRLGAVVMTGWTPTTEEDFEEAAGADIWEVVSNIANTAEFRIYPLQGGQGWTMTPAQRTPGTPVAIIPSDQLVDHVESWAPREVARRMFVHYSTSTGGTDLTAYGPHDSGRADPAYLETMPGAGEPGHASIIKALRWGQSRLAARNTLARQHTFTARMRPWIQPESTIRITDPAGDRDLMVSTTSVDPIAGEMTITAREIL